MTEWRNAAVGGRRWAGTPGRRPADRTLGAEELRRIVRVAEELRMDPQVVRIVLERDGGRIRTDVSLAASIRTVERALDGGVRAVPVGSPRP